MIFGICAKKKIALFFEKNRKNCWWFRKKQYLCSRN